MKRFVLAVALVAMGCEQTQTIGQCAVPETDESKDPFDAVDAGEGGAGGAGNDGGSGGAAGLVGGAPCVTNEDCAALTCLPSNSANFDASYCFDRQQDGCLVVTAPSPYAAMCSIPMGKVYVCGDSFDVTNLGTCSDVGTGALGETYRCCTNMP